MADTVSQSQCDFFVYSPWFSCDLAVGKINNTIAKLEQNRLSHCVSGITPKLSNTYDRGP